MSNTTKHLTEKQKKFVDTYLSTEDLNVTFAYKTAYPNTKNDNVAAASGSRLLKNAKVREYLHQRQQEAMKRTNITQDMIINELAAIGFAKTTNAVKIVAKKSKGSKTAVNHVVFTPTDQLSEADKKSIAGIKMGKNGIEIAHFDKVKALELWGKHLGMFTDNMNVNGNVGVNVSFEDDLDE